MLELLDYSPHILYQQLPKVRTMKLKCCEIVTGDSLVVDQLLAKLLNDYNQIEITLIHANKSLCQNLIKTTCNAFNTSKIQYKWMAHVNQASNMQFDVVVANLSSIAEDVSAIISPQVKINALPIALENILRIGKNYSIFIDKFFLHSADFKNGRNLLKRCFIHSILDFNRVVINKSRFEILNINFSNINQSNKLVKVLSTTTRITTSQDQDEITSDDFPNWLIYMDDAFRAMRAKMTFDIFDVDRDRQINSTMLSTQGKIGVLKSSHLSLDTIDPLVSFNADPCFITTDHKTLAIDKYLNADDVYLCPNMTAITRVFKKPKGYLINSSLSILTLKCKDIEINEQDLAFWKSPEFHHFYRIARNNSQRNLNIDKSAAFYFGVLNRNVI